MMMGKVSLVTRMGERFMYRRIFSIKNVILDRGFWRVKFVLFGIG